MRAIASLAALSCSLLAACSNGMQTSFTDTGAGTDAQDAAPAPDTHASDTAMSDAPMCSSNAQCDDGLPCTTDLCVIGGVCQHSSTCSSGLYCTASGCASTMTCTQNSDCNDQIPCTQDICAAGGTCQHLRDDSQCDVTMMQTCSLTLGCVAMGRCGVDQDCSTGRYCDGTPHCVNGACQAPTPINCDDMNACTTDSCDNTTMMCVHTPISPCGGTVQSGTYALSPPPQFNCVDGSIGPVNTITMTVTSTSVTVTGFSGTLMGGAPSMGMFSVSGPWAGSPCGGTITLSGSFTSPGMFMGSWSLTAGQCDVSCNSHFALTNGTLQ